VIQRQPPRPGQAVPGHDVKPCCSALDGEFPEIVPKSPGVRQPWPAPGCAKLNDLGSCKSLLQLDGKPAARRQGSADYFCVMPTKQCRDLVLIFHARPYGHLPARGLAGPRLRRVPDFGVSALRAGCDRRTRCRRRARHGPGRVAAPSPNEEGNEKADDQNNCCAHVSSLIQSLPHLLTDT
jgi:hypothetical protein